MSRTRLNQFLTSGFEFSESESQAHFRFRTLNYFMSIAVFFGLLIGVLGESGIMDIGLIQSRTNIIYAFFNCFLIFILRKDKSYFRPVAWAQVLASLIVFATALVTVINDEFRIAWFYVVIYLAYMLLGEKAGNLITLISISLLVFSHQYINLNLSDTAIYTAIFSLIVFGLLSRVYNSQIKSYENELMLKNNDLAESIKKLDIALEDAKTASKTKSLFLANMSHEIRTPMNGMLSLVQLLQTTRLDEKQVEYLQQVDRAGFILMNLIDDLLDLSRIESGKLKINPKTVKVWELLEDILLQAEHLFDDSDVNFNVEISDELPACIVVDDTRLKQVIINLINNAAKFTQQGEVSFMMDGQKFGKQMKLSIEVVDTGIGIPEDKKDSIFEPFQQISPARIYNKGVGLGLPICKRIVDAMNGQINLYSKEGKGTRVLLEFIFPIAEQNESEVDKPIFNTELDTLNILLVEDDRISRMAVETLFKDKGHRVSVAENGEQAVEYLGENKVDVVLMDVHMPVMTGIEATQIIKEQSLTSAPIIGMTASVMNDERKTYFEAGMDVLVEKPVNFEKLMAIIKSRTYD